MKRSALFLVLALVLFEWLDFSLYLYLAKAVFADTFFPPSSYSLTLSFALFAAAYCARPLGGWLFGREADLSGRRQPMVFSAAIMGFATLGICLLPGYAQIGLLATWGLLLLRVLQGLALGGEIITSAMFLVEHHPENPLFAGSLVAISGALGMFIGGSIASLLQAGDNLWAWRWVFAIVALLSLWICRLRKRLEESPEFDKKPMHLSELWQAHCRGLANIALVALFVSVTVYLCNAFWVAFAIDQQIWSRTGCAWVGSFAQLGSASFALVIAYKAKPKQVYRLLQASMVLISFTAPLLFYFTVQKQPVAVLLAIVGYALTNALICSTINYFLYLQLPVHYRCRGVSTVWAVAASVGAASLPLAEQVVRAGFLWFPALFVTMVAHLCLLGLRAYDGRGVCLMQQEQVSLT